MTTRSTGAANTQRLAKSKESEGPFAVKLKYLGQSTSYSTVVHDATGDWCRDGVSCSSSRRKIARRGSVWFPSS